MDIYGIFGAGGFGREVMPVARQMLQMTQKRKSFELVFVVEKLSKETVINGHRVISETSFLQLNNCKRYFNVAIGNSGVRERIAKKMIGESIEPFTIRDISAQELDEDSIGNGAILCPFTCVTSNVKIGAFFQCNIYSYVAHDCVIGDYVTFAPAVHCNGNVIVEDHAYIGTGAMIKQGTSDRPLVIGKGATVGMGAVVTKSVANNITVVGNPATELRKGND